MEKKISAKSDGEIREILRKLNSTDLEKEEPPFELKCSTDTYNFDGGNWLSDLSDREIQEIFKSSRF